VANCIFNQFMYQSIGYNCFQFNLLSKERELKWSKNKTKSDRGREHCSTERIFIYPQSRAGSLGTCFNFLFSNGFLICIRSSQLELLRFGCRVFHGNVARGNKPKPKKINSFHATYPNSPHVHLLDLPL